MLSPTLREGLKVYAIGPWIRAIRLKKEMGLVELGRHTGLSPAMLSKIERGQLFPTLPTLLRIALVFSVGLDTSFQALVRSRRSASCVGHGERRAGCDDEVERFRGLPIAHIRLDEGQTCASLVVECRPLTVRRFQHWPFWLQPDDLDAPRRRRLG
jgi:transcriptional regulator with XRE-family HTH domain